MESARKVQFRINLQHADGILRANLTKGKEIFTISTHRNQSNTAASVIMLISHTDSTGHHTVVNISAYVARVMEAAYDDENHGVRLFGGQLDLGNHAVDWLSRHYHGEGNQLVQRRL